MSLIDKKLEDLKAAQENGTYTLCPRCGRATMNPELKRNALSRLAHIMVCDDCGVDEAKLAYMRATESLYSWAAFQPDRPPCEFRSLSAEEVWGKLCKEQMQTLTQVFERYLNGESSEEIRRFAFENCPGLAQFWTEPYRMDYTSADGRVVVRFKRTDTGIEMTGSLIKNGKEK